MTDPKRLLEEGTALEASLLGAALDDAPRKGLDRRIHVALGIGGIAISAGTASTTAAAASKAAPYLVSFGIAKWVGIVVIGAGAVVSAVAVVHHESVRPAAPVVAPMVAHPAAVPPPTVPVSSSPGGLGVSPDVPGGIPPGPPGVAAPEPIPEAHLTIPKDDPNGRGGTSPMTPSRGPRAAVPLSAEAPVAPAESKPALTAEMRLMDGATAALDSGDARLALTLLDRHDLEFLHGQMAPEALELRIRAYGLRHDDAKVVELGRAFLSRYPDNPLVPRVRALIGESERR